MKNIHVLPTDKPSRLCYVICTEKSTLTLFEDKMEKSKRFFPQNIYITNDEEIKHKDIVIEIGNSILIKVVTIAMSKTNDGRWKKIILTTDKSLDCVQPIDDEFLEWFVKNPSCDEVETFIDTMGCTLENCDANPCINYKIIIPKEEPNPFELPKALPDDVFYGEYNNGK